MTSRPTGGRLRRTTVAALPADLRTLEAEAERRRVPLATVLREAVEDKARQLRERRRPRVGAARPTDSRSAADPDHRRCALLLTDANEDLAVPALVLAELDHWCGRRLPPEAWLIFLDDVLAGVYRVEPPTGEDLARCRALQARYSDLRLGVVDASVVALAERLGEPRVATLDQRHFRAVRPVHVEALEIRP